MRDKIFYAIGDIHGKAERLKKLHIAIGQHHKKNYPEKQKIIVHLGDYIDRGDDSFGVLEFLSQLDDGNVINLMGNHEQMMLDACLSEESVLEKVWLDNGGNKTITSYQKHGYETTIEKHIEWIRTLPSYYWDKEAGFIFVHAGLDPVRFPFEDDNIHRWTRSERFFKTQYWMSEYLENMRVIHGHTPTKSQKPDITPCGQRINIDTGACYGGPLTAAILLPNNNEITFLYS